MNGEEVIVILNLEQQNKEGTPQAVQPQWTIIGFWFSAL